MGIVKFEAVENKILSIRGMQVILDSDVAELYGVETKRINEAVKNNPRRFPQGYLFELTGSELEDLRSKFSTAKFSKTRSLPKAFTEKGLYMLATILSSEKAIETTIAIIETFAKIKSLSTTIKSLTTVQDKQEQHALMQKSGQIIAEILDDDLVTNESETTIELNFAVLIQTHY
jgi:phage regulator Rha-like protein